MGAGPSRSAAMARLVAALQDVKVRGEVRCSVDYLRDMCGAPELQKGEVDTGWLDARIAAQVLTLLETGK